MAKPHAIFQSFLLEMLGFIHTFMNGNFDPELSRGFEAIAILDCPNGILHVFSLTKLLPVSIL